MPKYEPGHHLVISGNGNGLDSIRHYLPIGTSVVVLDRDFVEFTDAPGMYVYTVISDAGEIQTVDDVSLSPGEDE